MSNILGWFIQMQMAGAHGMKQSRNELVRDGDMSSEVRSSAEVVKMS
jgi:hypothetical protein